MRRGFIFALVLMSAAGLIVQCGGSSSSPSFPSLAGTWTGSAWVGDLPGAPQAAGLAAEPLVVVDCPTVDGISELELVLDSDGTPTDLLICGDSINLVIGTVEGAVAQVDASENVMWVTFSDAVSGSELFAGGVVLDNSFDYATVFFWDSQTDEDIIFGVLQRTVGVVPFSEAAMEGSWSGFLVDFWEDVDINFEKLSPLDATLSQGGSLFMSGTDPDGTPFAGVVTMEDTDYGYVEGTLTVKPGPMGVQPLIIGIDLSLEGFVSRDGEFFGASVEEIDGPINEWSIINLRKDEILE